MLLRIFFSTVILSGCLLLGAFFAVFESKEIDLVTFQQQAKTQPSVILDDQGNELARFALDKKEPITIDQIPPVVIKAFVAAEDHSFFSHYGVSLKGIARSMLVNLYYQKKVQGASTITQQVARLMFLTHERTWRRKLHEVVIALQLERQLSKEQILELYLNNIYFGRGIYGVEAACNRFWGKSVDQVTVDEAAMLAAVAKSARFYSPLNAPRTAKHRRNVVLHCMKLLHFISDDEYRQAKGRDLEIKDFIPGNKIRLYIQEWIRSWAEKKWGREALYHQGLRIKTSINADIQEKAEKAFTDHMLKNREKLGDGVNGGMVVLDVPTGKVRSLIGGFDYQESQFNRVFQASRPLASSFKPLLYACAFEAGLTADMVMKDEPFAFEQGDGTLWKPRNWYRDFDGDMTLARALAISNNIITIKLLLKIGMEPVAKKVKLFGLTDEFKPYPSSAIGTIQANVMENAAAFNVFANDGVYVKPYMIEWVKDKWGKRIWSCQPEKRRVLDSKLNSKMVKILTYRMKLAKKRNRSGKWFDAQAIGKTGSSNEAASTWFVGATPELSSAIYVGRDNNTPMGRYIFGSTTALPIWVEFAKSLKYKKKDFYYDPSLREVVIDWWTGQRKEYDNGKDTITILE